MSKILERFIVQILKKTGFDSVEPKALEMFMQVYNDRISSFLCTASQKTAHSMKTTTSFIDILSLKNQMPRIGNSLPFTEEMYRECNVSIPTCKYKYVRELFSLVTVPREVFPEEMIEAKNEWISPISTKVEKYIHIYDFMPEFPPIHTFRTTLIRTHNNKNQSVKVKNRLEQSLSSEGNMVKLIKSSGTMPKFINFMYKRV